MVIITVMITEFTIPISEVTISNITFSIPFPQVSVTNISVTLSITDIAIEATSGFTDIVISIYHDASAANPSLTPPISAIETQLDMSQVKSNPIQLTLPHHLDCQLA
jgi:hypothetical protein